MHRSEVSIQWGPDLYKTNFVVDVLYSLVPVEMTLILASMFRKYKFKFPEGFIPPNRVDVFTMELEHGLELNVVPR